MSIRNKLAFRIPEKPKLAIKECNVTWHARIVPVNTYLQNYFVNIGITKPIEKLGIKLYRGILYSKIPAREAGIYYAAYNATIPTIQAISSNGINATVSALQGITERLNSYKATWIPDDYVKTTTANTQTVEKADLQYYIVDSDMTSVSYISMIDSHDLPFEVTTCIYEIKKEINR